VDAESPSKNEKKGRARDAGDTAVLLHKQEKRKPTQDIGERIGEDAAKGGKKNLQGAEAIRLLSTRRVGKGAS